MKRRKKKDAPPSDATRRTAKIRVRASRLLSQAQARHSWRQCWKVHPALEAIPPLGATEVRALAESIRQHGLLQPIHIATVDGVTYLLDGRGRLDALELLGWQIVVNAKGKWRGRMAAKGGQP